MSPLWRMAQAKGSGVVDAPDQVTDSERVRPHQINLFVLCVGGGRFWGLMVVPWDDRQHG